MKRDRALFDQSRLYRQAAEGASAVFDHFKCGFPTFAPLLRLLKARTVTLCRAEEVQRVLDVANKHALSASYLVHSQLAIPSLVQAITEFYYGDANQTPFWLGTTLKRTLAAIAQKVYGYIGGGKKAHKLLCEAVSAT